MPKASSCPIFSSRPDLVCSHRWYEVSRSLRKKIKMYLSSHGVTKEKTTRSCSNSRYDWTNMQRYALAEIASGRCIGMVVG